MLHSNRDSLRFLTLCCVQDPIDPNPAQIEEFLKERVTEMVAKLAAEKKSADLPLIRLRVFTRCVLVCPRLEAWSTQCCVLAAAVPIQVDYTGFPKINVQRFGRDFLGKIANCGSSILCLRLLLD